MMEQVIEFNHKVLGISKRPVGHRMSLAEVEHLRKCLAEEANEFVEAYEYGDIIKQIDALIDSLYFAYGGLYKLGLSHDMVGEIFAAVHEANMTKKKGVVARRGDGSAADATKPDGWVGPEERIGEILDRYTEKA